MDGVELGAEHMEDNQELRAVQEHQRSLLNRNTERIMEHACLSQGEGDTSAAEISPRALFTATASICRQVNATISKQSADRTRGRFWSQEIIAGAMLEATDADYMSDEDTIAVHFEYDKASDEFEVGLAERLFKKTTKGRSALESATQVSINADDGVVQCHWFVPEMTGRGRQRVQARIDGELVYALYLGASATTNKRVSTEACISVVDMKWHEASQRYTLDRGDELALIKWMEDMRAPGVVPGQPLAGSAAAEQSRPRPARVPKPRAQKRKGGVRVAGPKTRAEKRQQKAKRRVSARSVSSAPPAAA